MEVNISRSQRRRRNRKARAAVSTQIVVSNQNPTGSQQTKRKQKRSRRRGGRSSRGSMRGSPYLMTLLHPETVTGVKIPDLVTYPSSTFQLQYSVTGTTGAGGDSLAAVLQPCIWGGGSFTNYPIKLCFGGTATSTLPAGTSMDWAQGVGIRNMIRAYRCVSASIRAEYIGTTQSNSGYFIAGQFNGSTEIGSLNFGSVAYLEGIPNATICSINRNPECTVLWRPVDNSQFEYTYFDNLGGTRGNLVFPYIYMVATGIQGTPIRFVITANYEALPLQDNLNLIETSVSPSDPATLSSVMNALSPVASSMQSIVLSELGSMTRKAVSNYAPAAINYAASYVSNRLGGSNRYRLEL